MDSHASRGLNEVNAPQDSSLNTARGDRATDGSSCLSGQADSFGFEGDGLVDLAVGADLGGVTIVRLLAEGGMGRVYEGRQQAPSRAVAVKVLRNGLASPALMRQFEQEAHLLARLRHPHIAQVHTLGTWRYGGVVLPFFVMELVEAAQAIDCHARDHRLPMRQRVDLMRRVAAAVAYGHALGVVHRDLKPGNILVGADGEPKVIDFGVARATDVDRALATLQTDAGQIVGTLRYMSPEQIDANSGQIGPWTDVYALGLVLHEVLSGDLPYDVRGQPIMVAARIIREVESQAMFAIPRAVAVDPAVPAADARSLAAIVGKCLQKRPADRYMTAADLQAELARWLAGQPVLARPPGQGERALRWLRRHRTMVAAAVAVCLAALSVLVFSSRASYHEAAADQQRMHVQSERYHSSLQRAAEAGGRRTIGAAARLLEQAGALAAAVPGRPIELDCLAAMLDDCEAVLHGHAAPVRAVAASADGRLVLTGSDDGTARIWSIDAEGIFHTAHVLRGHSGPIWSAAFAADGSRAVTAADGKATVWSVEDGSMITEMRCHESTIYGIVFSPDGQMLATAAGDGSVRLWDAATGEQRAVFAPEWPASARDQNIYGVAFSADGARLAAACGDGVVRLWDLGRALDTQSAPVTLLGHTRRVFAVCFSPDGRWIASASEDATARLWNVENGSVGGVFRHSLRVNGVAFNASGSRLATVSADAILRLWDPATGRTELELVGHRDAVWGVARLSAERFVTAAADTTARVWDGDRGDQPILADGAGDTAGEGQGVRGVAYSPDGRLAATATSRGLVQLWDPVTCRNVRDIPAGRSRVNSVEFSPAGDLLAAGCGDGVTRLIRVADSTEVGRFAGHSGPVFAAAFSPDGCLLASAGDQRGSGTDGVSSGSGQAGTVRIRRLPGGDDAVAPLEHPGSVYGAAWSPDGTRLATACGDGLVRVWDAAAGRLQRTLAGHRLAVNWVAFSPDGSRLASCASDGTVRFWDARDGRLLAVLEEPVGQVWEVAFSPDGSRLAGVGADGCLHLWHAESGRHLLALGGHSAQAWGVVFAPDGTGILTGAQDGTARLWGVSPATVHRRRAGRESGFVGVDDDGG